VAEKGQWNSIFSLDVLTGLLVPAKTSSSSSQTVLVGFVQ
jgi:hypothetical protein